ncbi:hypothetical protein BG011_003369 [Mortierella polycephala]|uniref:Zinc finger Mcm10/DnaG-type domain-containing protein n=1 Tax=Mortierella polycephala TaxID=41804 RepID=A0A9P6Q4H6_9FUNG|nr:hypothetical protein BG011_003369 [Mortierella polycephala]
MKDDETGKGSLSALEHTQHEHGQEHQEWAMENRPCEADVMTMQTPPVYSKSISPIQTADAKRKRVNNHSGHSSSSSEGEDLALLEEVTKIKARLEAKLRAKQQKKLTKGADTINSHTLSTSKVPTELTSSQTKNQDLISATHQSPSTAEMSATSTAHLMESAEATTPTNNVKSPLLTAFRTPSPPPRTQFLMSPPSGASSRKRQHSPSPLPRRCPASVRPRHGSTTPTARPIEHLNFSKVMADGLKEPLSFDSVIDRVATNSKRNSARSGDIGGTLEHTFDSQGDNFDDIFIDAEVYDDEFERLSPEPVTTRKSTSLASDTSKWGPNSSSATFAMTERFEANKREREASLATAKDTKPTFQTITANAEPMSIQESTRLGHAPDFDPLTGLRIRDRITACEQVARMTHKLKVIPIEDSDLIREKSTQCHSTGKLSSFTATSASVGRLGDRPIVGMETKATGPENWIVAGVIGAKSKPRMTSKKVPYCHLQLCDLRRSAINVFMFRDVMKRYHETLQVGDVIALMDPQVVIQAEHSGTLGVKIEHPDCLLVIGIASDFGRCEAVKKNDENCGAILDRRASAYCNYHIMLVANKRRNQRGGLIAGTSSIYDLERPQSNPRAAPLARWPGGDNKPNFQSRARQTMGDSAQDTTYIFEDEGVGTSSRKNFKSPRKSTQPHDESLSSFLMNQNNPGGQYLRQAKVSKDVTWAKDVPSPKTPTKSSELFPSEMVRRMGYDPVTGQFVHGSPKRTNDDPDARERSIRLLAERVKSPPGPISPLSDVLAISRKCTMDVGGTTRKIAIPRTSRISAAQARKHHIVQSNTTIGNKPTSLIPGSHTESQKWVDLDDGSSGSGSETDGQGRRLLSLDQQRAKNILESKKRNSLLNSTKSISTTSTPVPAAQHLEKQEVTISQPLDGISALANGGYKATPQRIEKQVLIQGESQPRQGSRASTNNPPKCPSSITKQKFIDFSDSE